MTFSPSVSPTTGPSRPPATAIPSWCQTWWDGCNRCEVANGKLGKCTKMHCAPERETKPYCMKGKEPQTPGPTASMTFSPSVSPTTGPTHPPATAIPSWCQTWWDGCNRCEVANGKLGTCTKMHCAPERETKPYCMKGKEPQTPGPTASMTLSPSVSPTTGPTRPPATVPTPTNIPTPLPTLMPTEPPTGAVTDRPTRP